MHIDISFSAQPRKESTNIVLGSKLRIKKKFDRNYREETGKNLRFLVRFAIISLSIKTIETIRRAESI